MPVQPFPGASEDAVSAHVFTPKDRRKTLWFDRQHGQSEQPVMSRKCSLRTVALLV